MKIKLNEIDVSLGTRRLGCNLRTKVLQTEEEVIFDFRGIDIVSNSFADECFGKLIDDIGLDKFKKRIMFDNTNYIIKSIIKKVVIDRLKKQHEGVCVH